MALHGPDPILPRRREPKPKVTPTNQLYSRPTPDPFSQSYSNGYSAGENGVPPILGMNKPADYWAGFKDGKEDRNERDALGSSNS